MNRRKCIGLLAALLPCTLVARMLGEKEVHATPTPETEILNHKDILSKMIPEFVPTSGFHIEIQERVFRYDEDGNPSLPVFRAIIRDCKGTQQLCSIQSPVFELGDISARRRALDALYTNLSHVIRRRQFPQDTLIYDTEVTVNGVKLMNPRYPK